MRDDAGDDRRILRRVLSESHTKLWLGALLGVAFCAGYFALQRVPIRPPTTFRQTWLDDAVGFSPGWAWAYVSLYLLLPTAWLAPTRHDEATRPPMARCTRASPPANRGSGLRWLRTRGSPGSEAAADRNRECRRGSRKA